MRPRTLNLEQATSDAVPRGASGVGRCVGNFGCFLLIALFATLAFRSSAQETTRVYLSGHDKDDAVPWEFQCTSGANSGVWTNLPVPSQWDMKGFGTLSYHRDSFGAYDEKGLYAKNFFAPQKWATQRVFLVFDGVMTDTSARLNGESVGPTHQGGFYRFKYEITDLLKFGETNRLEVTVAKHSANASVNNAERNADYWVFGGIYRPVYLEIVPREFIERVAIDAKADGNFSAQVFCAGITNASDVEAQIETLEGKRVGAPFRSGIIFGDAGSEVSNLKSRITSPKLWTAETPNLYFAKFRLKRNGRTIHEFTQRFGFRTFEVRDGDGLYLNGRRIVLKGADRHSFWPDSGRCLSEKIHRLDIETMKDMNMNAVRMSHYPPDARFLDLCDELGLYVLDELAGWHRHYDDEIGAKLVHEMIARDVNHPSILFWDNGNEGGFNTNLDHIFPELDPQHRRVLHPWAAFGGVNTAHYLDYEQAKIACDGNPLYYHSKGGLFADTNDTAKYIYMPTEFQHGLFDGGAGAGLEDYWNLMTSSKYLGGGFIWVLEDDAVKRPDTGQMDTAGNQAPDGIVGPYREREGSFYAIKEIWSPIQVRRETNGTFTIENHYSFTDASQCQFVFEQRELDGLLRRTPRGYRVRASRRGAAPHVLPGATGVIRSPFRERKAEDFNKVSATHVLALRVSDPAGRELWTWVWPDPPSSSMFPRLERKQLFEHPSLTETPEMVELKTETSTVEFSKRTGLLAGVKGFSLTDGPRSTAAGSELKQFSITTNGNSVVIRSDYDGSLKSVVWRVRSDGWVVCDYTYIATGTNDYFGVLFDYPENLVKHKRWLGDGPYRVWKNRLRGVTLGVWENDYNNTITGWRDWVYPEFKGFFSNVRWLQLDTTEGQITVVNNSGVPFVQVLTPEFPPEKLVGKTYVPVPKCGIGFLDAIPAVGSKFKDATFTGPQGQPNVGRGEYSGSVSFYFGALR